MEISISETFVNPPQMFASICQTFIHSFTEKQMRPDVWRDLLHHHHHHHHYTDAIGKIEMAFCCDKHLQNKTQFFHEKHIPYVYVKSKPGQILNYILTLK